MTGQGRGAAAKSALPTGHARRGAPEENTERRHHQRKTKKASTATPRPEAPRQARNVGATKDVLKQNAPQHAFGHESRHGGTAATSRQSTTGRELQVQGFSVRRGRPPDARGQEIHHPHQPHQGTLDPLERARHGNTAVSYATTKRIKGGEETHRPTTAAEPCSRQCHIPRGGWSSSATTPSQLNASLRDPRRVHLTAGARCAPSWALQCGSRHRRRKPRRQWWVCLVQQPSSRPRAAVSSPRASTPLRAPGFHASSVVLPHAQQAHVAAPISIGSSTGATV